MQVCQREIDDLKRSWSCGSVDGAIWSVQGLNPLVVTVAYNNGDENSDKNKRSVLTAWCLAACCMPEHAS